MKAEMFVNTWRNYNRNGADGGRWVSVPMSNEALETFLKNLAESLGETVENAEFCVHDMDIDEAPDEINAINLDISDYSHPEEANSIFAELEEIDQDGGLEALAAILEAYTSSIDEALKICRRGDYVFYEGMDIEEVAEEFFDECYPDCPEQFRRYIDFEAFARDLSFEGYYEAETGVIYIG